MTIERRELAIPVILADDHQLVREGLRRVLAGAGDIEIVAEAGNGPQVLDLLARHAVRVVVLDLSMPGLSGMELIARVKSEHPQVAILVLTMHAEEQYAIRAFRAGAVGYVTKDSAGDELLRAIRTVAAGRGYVTPALAGQLAVGLSQRETAVPHALLSDREMEVFRHIVAGQRLTEVAETLQVSVKTVSTHKARILEKMGLPSTAALIRYGLEHRLFDDPEVAR